MLLCSRSFQAARAGLSLAAAPGLASFNAWFIPSFPRGPGQLIACCSASTSSSPASTPPPPPPPGAAKKGKRRLDVVCQELYPQASFLPDILRGCWGRGPNIDDARVPGAPRIH